MNFTTAPGYLEYTVNSHQKWCSNAVLRPRKAFKIYGETELWLEMNDAGDDQKGGGSGCWGSQGGCGYKQKGLLYIQGTKLGHGSKYKGIPTRNREQTVTMNTTVVVQNNLKKRGWHVCQSWLEEKRKNKNLTTVQSFTDILVYSHWHRKLSLKAHHLWSVD